ncbi:putative N(2),N(2)-dimethylguanosine tRNA methyltransferase [Papilio machaon]|uniref:tRNA (guanine(26)-N(2))-dimethyltransferase n=1 Tax=Papilio machaon TaxID=76193 RepID=A0A0N1PHA6_PAPMA|nr:putative N(2),N(2)-dimethylguanosine tRNA methyltransferase [Papilio machaon]
MKMEESTLEIKSLKTIKEGQAEICLKTDKVFYNPVQEFNRDLSIAVLSVFTEEFIAEKLALKQKKTQNVNSNINNDNNQIPVTILEALSATGLRSIRYAKEVPNISKIIANDLSKDAVNTIQENIIHNNVQNIIETSHDDACMLMYKHKHPMERFTVIDLDPYGCPSIFLDSAVQSVQDGGLLLVTATDMAVLAGNSPETCYSKYGAISLKTKCCHEMALRILLQCIESHANRYGRYTVPMLSISADFYIRVFVKVYSGAIHCKKTTSKLSMVYQCVGCDNITLQPLGGFKDNPTERNPGQMKAYLPTGPAVGERCTNCNQKHHLGGPIWSAPIHDEVFVSKVLTHVQEHPDLFGTAKRLDGVLSMVREELMDAPLYYILDKMFGRVHCETMPMLVMRLEADPVASHILSQDTKTVIDLSERADANPVSRRDGRLRFQFNPTPYWGPGSRAAINVGDDKMSKAIKNQNKHKNKERRQGKREHSPRSDEETRKIHAKTDDENI